MEFDFEQLKRSLETGDDSEMTQALDTLQNLELSDAEQGEVYAAIASIYMDIDNDINAAYDTELSNVLETVQPIEALEYDIKDG